MHKRRPDIERTLRIRVAALAANNSLGDLCANDPLGKWHRLTGDHLGQWAGKVSANERIVIEPQEDGVRVIGLSEGLQSTEARIIDIGDYH